MVTATPIEQLLERIKDKFDLRLINWVNFFEGVVEGNYWVKEFLGSEIPKEDLLYLSYANKFCVCKEKGKMLKLGLITRYGCFLLLADGSIIKDGFYKVFSSDYEQILLNLLNREIKQDTLFMLLKYLNKTNRFNKSGVVLLENDILFTVPHIIEENVDTAFYESAFFYFVLFFLS